MRRSSSERANLTLGMSTARQNNLGKISFAFYVVHGPVLHCLGYSIMPNIWNLTGKIFERARKLDAGDVHGAPEHIA
jgi:peptidoglycan/LPS O-acetylase OafA/YrhL